MHCKLCLQIRVTQMLVQYIVRQFSSDGKYGSELQEWKMLLAESFGNTDLLLGKKDLMHQLLCDHLGNHVISWRVELDADRLVVMVSMVVNCRNGRCCWLRALETLIYFWGKGPNAPTSL